MNKNQIYYKGLAGLAIVSFAWLDQYFNFENMEWGKFEHLPDTFLGFSAFYLIHLLLTKLQVVPCEGHNRNALRFIQYILLVIFGLLVLVKSYASGSWVLIDVVYMICTLAMAILPEMLLDAVFGKHGNGTQDNEPNEVKS